MTDKTLSAEERIERAEREVIRLTGSGPGGQHDRNFRMTVPAEPDRDSDLVLMDGLQAGREALAARERPSALDVEALSLLRAASLLPNDGIVVPRIRSFLARLTEPDAGEGTCVLSRFGLTPHSHRCTAEEDRAAIAPDTTEATLPVPPYHDDRGDLQEAWIRGYRAALQQPAAQPEEPHNA
jgi:hypothetical protein